MNDFQRAGPSLTSSFPKTPSRALKTAASALTIAAIALGLALAAGTVYGLLRDPAAAPLVSIGPAAETEAGAAANAGEGTANESAAASAASVGRADVFGADDFGMDASGNYAAGVFTGIGRLRIPLNAEPGARQAAVLSVVFPYASQDSAFAEELASRLGELRQITSDYFSAYSAESLRTANEADLKTGLVERYNKILRLGKINSVYFNDFVILD